MLWKLQAGTRGLKSFGEFSGKYLSYAASVRTFQSSILDRRVTEQTCKSTFEGSPEEDGLYAPLEGFQVRERNDLRRLVARGRKSGMSTLVDNTFHVLP
jgi:hypothetical protein